MLIKCLLIEWFRSLNFSNYPHDEDRSNVTAYYTRDFTTVWVLSILTDESFEIPLNGLFVPYVFFAVKVPFFVVLTLFSRLFVIYETCDVYRARDSPAEPFTFLSYFFLSFSTLLIRTIFEWGGCNGYRWGSARLPYPSSRWNFSMLTRVALNFRFSELHFSPSGAKWSTADHLDPFCLLIVVDRIRTRLGLYRPSGILEVVRSSFDDSFRYPLLYIGSGSVRAK